jgi:hypothetical protein
METKNFLSFSFLGIKLGWFMYINFSVKLLVAPV